MDFYEDYRGYYLRGSQRSSGRPFWRSVQSAERHGIQFLCNSRWKNGSYGYRRCKLCGWMAGKCCESTGWQKTGLPDRTAYGAGSLCEYWKLCKSISGSNRCCKHKNLCHDEKLFPKDGSRRKETGSKGRWVPYARKTRSDLRVRSDGTLAGGYGYIRQHGQGSVRSRRFWKIRCTRPRGTMGWRSTPLFYRYCRKIRFAGTEAPESSRYAGYPENLFPARSGFDGKSWPLHWKIRYLVFLSSGRRGRCGCLYFCLRQYKKSCRIACG